MQQPRKASAESSASETHDSLVRNLEHRIRDLSTQSSQEQESPGRRRSRRPSDELIPDPSILVDLEQHARSILTNVDMVLRDLRGSLRGMSDLTLESMQTFSSSINSTCENMDATIKSMYTLLAKAEELNANMASVQKLAQQIKDMKKLVDLFETHFQSSLT